MAPAPTHRGGLGDIAAASAILACQAQEHERSAGLWAAEWPTFPALALVTSGALAPIVEIAGGLEVDAERMRANLDLTHGLIMAEAVAMKLAAFIGKADAHKLIEEASQAALRSGRNLKDVLLASKTVTARIPAAELAALFDPMNYQGVSQQLIDRLLASAKSGK